MPGATDPPPLAAPFSKSAQYYDLLYVGKDYVSEAKMYERWLEPAHCLWNFGTRNTLIEFGCGTGKFGAELKKQFGWDVTGIDTSPEMVALANKNWIAARVGDMASSRFARSSYTAGSEPTVINYESWNAAIIPFSGLCYAAATEYGLSQCLDNLRAAVSDGGRVVLDVTNYAAAVTSLRPHDWRVAGGGDGKPILYRTCKKRFDPKSSLLRYEMQFQVVGNWALDGDGMAIDGGEVLDEWCEHHVLRTFTPTELTTALGRAGFRVLFIGNMEGEPQVEPDDWSFLIAATALRR